MRNLAARFYYYSAVIMPLWFDWQWVYVMRARFYMEQRTADSWPWKWTAFDPAKRHVSDFGKPLGF